MATVMLTSLVAAALAGTWELPPEVRELYSAGALLGDRTKLLEAWQKAQSPAVAAALTDTWLFEQGAAIDEELLGTPPFLQILRRWEEIEPDNALVPCLREVFLSTRGKRLPDWETVRRQTAWKRRVAFHLREAREGALGVLLARRGNCIETWLRWLGRGPLNNLERFSGLIQLGLLQARFLLLTDRTGEAAPLLQTLRNLVEKVSEEADEIVLQRVALTAAVTQEEILADLIVQNGKNAAELIKRYRALRRRQTDVLGRLTVLSALQEQFLAAYRIAYQEIRAPRWEDVPSVDPQTMAAFAREVTHRPAEAVARFWAYRVSELEDVTKDLEKNLDIFATPSCSRAQAARFMDLLRSAVTRKEGVPVWTIPSFVRVVRSYRNAAALGRRELKGKAKEAFAWLVGSLTFYAGLEKDTKRWIDAFQKGKAHTYLLLAFAKHNVKEAVPAVAAQFRRIVREGGGLQDCLQHILCLERLTGKSFGVDPEAWYRYLESTKQTD